MKKLLRGISLLLTLLLLLTPLASALTLTQAQELLETNYISELPQAARDATTVADMIAALNDPYTQYFTPEGYKVFTDSMKDREQVGVGVQFAVTKVGGKIFNVFADSSAEKAGIVIGDIIVAIEGESILGKTTAEVKTLMSGEAGTSVKLKLLHKNGVNETVVLTRNPFTILTTESELKDGHIGYISCLAFGPETYAHFSDAITKYDGAADRWIVDLRGNGGGNVQSAIDAASAFAGSGKLSYIQDRSGQLTAVSAGNDALTVDPVIVLVDENTASASELFAAIIRDRKAGLILGTRTFGKGVAQTIKDQSTDPAAFADGSGMKITAYRAYSENLLCHDGAGLLPHLLLDEAQTSKAAFLLSATNPGDQNLNFLRVHVGGWRFYVNLTQAGDKAYEDALVALLEALPASVQLYLGTGTGTWNTTTPKAVAATYAPTYKDPAAFTDISGSTYAAEIKALAAFSIVKGGGDGTFRPAANLNRAELCALLAQAMGYKKTEGKSQFTDVPETAWYTPYVNTLSDMGIVNGVGGGRFAPADPMSHQQFMALLSRTAAKISYTAASALKEGPTPEELAGYANYAPWAQKDVWLLDGMYYDAAKNIPPNAPTTREQAACCLYKMMSKLGILVN
ncbi:MAG: S41 family peptidase [Oscillospiraceae bacterium]